MHEQKGEICKGEKMKLAKVNDQGDVICPQCGCNIVTPSALSPYTRQVEKMVLIAGNPGKCPMCATSYQVNAEEALKHNAWWYPEDYKQ